MIKRRCAVLLALLLLLGAVIGCGASEGTTEEVFDFFEQSSDGLPLGWSIVSYENAYSVSCDNGIVTLSTEVADDVRLVHTVPVAGGKKYVFEADVAVNAVQGGQGATLSVDNYSIDGSYIYSEGVYGTKDWTHVVLAFVTDQSQDSVQLALRLGGYSSQTSGTVRFRNVSISASENAGVSFQRLSVADNSSSSGSDKTNEQYEAYFSLILWEAVFAAAFLVYGIYLHRDKIRSLTISPTGKWVYFAVLAAVGLVLRISLCSRLKGHATDMNCWIAWGNQVADGKLSTFYDGTWYDYPPGYMLILGVQTLLMRLFRIADWGSETLRLFCYMLPPFLCDIGCGVLVMRFAKEQKQPGAVGLLLAGLVVLNPAMLYLSGAWGQIDSILTFFLLLSFEALRKERRILCGVWYAIAILIKWQALIYGPVIALVYLATIVTEKDKTFRKKQILHTVLAVLIALAIVFVVSLPFKGNMSVFWIVERFLKASSGYDYATIEGYNFFALLGANWHRATLDVFGGAGWVEALMQSLTALGKLLVPIMFCTLGAAAWNELRERQGHAALVSLAFLLASTIVINLFLVYFPNAESIGWMLYNVVAVIAFLGGGLQLAEKSSFSAFFSENETARFGLAVSALAGTVILFLFSLRTVLSWFGVTLSYTVFGTIMIALAFGAVVWILLRYRKADLLHTQTPELLYLCAGCFMTWVFTFGHYMHERYVIPVLVLLLFVYAVTEDRRILLAAVLLTVSTFLNEMVAMYVVSEGAIDVIRGGERHNQILEWCSALEVSAALYLTVAVAMRLRTLTKGGEVK